MVIRRAIEDTTLTTIDNNFYRFRKGDYIMFYSPLLHYDDEVYQNPSVSFEWWLKEVLNCDGNIDFLAAYVQILLF